MHKITEMDVFKQLMFPIIITRFNESTMLNVDQNIHHKDQSPAINLNFSYETHKTKCQGRNQPCVEKKPFHDALDPSILSLNQTFIRTLTYNHLIFDISSLSVNHSYFYYISRTAQTAQNSS